MTEPIYDEIFIVAIKKNQKINWYIANKYLWIMNLNILSKEELEDYFSDSELKEIRKDFIELSSENIVDFLNKIEKYKVNIDLLKLKILERISNNDINSDELIDFYPTLLIDIDNNIFYSQYPEPFAFENYIPKNWIGKYESFMTLIDEKDMYWMHRGKNILGL